MSATEYRGEAALGCEIRQVHEGDRTLELRVVNYGVADSYGSVWEPGVFRASLETKRPSACWSHDWARIIGSLKEHDERADGLDGLVQMADFDAVPDAKMAWSLLKDKHLTNTSFGFKRQDGGWSDTRAAANKLPGERERMRAARLDEVSPVLVGSVPGAGVLNVRSEALGGTVAIADASQLLVMLSSGAVTLRDALGQLEGRAEAAAEEREEEQEPEIPEQRAITANELEDVWAMMYADGLCTRAELSEVRAAGKGGNEARLKLYWSKGKGAAKLAWGTRGDHTRCVHELSKYVGPGVVHGLCTNIQELAIGHAGNPLPSERGEARESETESSPTT